jgi:hypothetical protein
MAAHTFPSPVWQCLSVLEFQKQFLILSIDFRLVVLPVINPASIDLIRGNGTPDKGHQGVTGRRFEIQHERLLAWKTIELEQLNKKYTRLPLKEITLIPQFTNALLEFQERTLTVLRLYDQVELAVAAFLFIDFLLVGQVEKFADKNHLGSPSQMAFK